MVDPKNETCIKFEALKSAVGKIITSRQPNTYMYFYGHKIKTIAIKGNPVDQSSCKKFNKPYYSAFLLRWAIPNINTLLR